MMRNIIKKRLTLHEWATSSINWTKSYWIVAITPTKVHITPVNVPMYSDGKLK